MERSFVSWLTDRLSAHSEVILGIGDDCAVVDSRGTEQVLATDMLCDGVHFELEKIDPRLAGRKALAVNLSDFAAMAAKPHYALVSLLCPRDAEERLAREVFEGLLELAAQHGVAIVGGDTNRWDGALVINVALTGVPTGPNVLRRQDARVGDVILVSGALGGSILGHHLTFQPRVEEAIQVHREFDLHAAMDISDGLLLDLERLTVASRVGAELDESQIPISTDAQRWAKTTGRSPLEHALTDGEDFELLITADAKTANDLESSRAAGLEWRCVGRIVETPGLIALREGTRHPLEARGYLH